MYAPAGNFRKQFKKLLGVDISPYHIHMVLQNLGIKPITTEYFGKPNISLYNINQVKYLLDNNKDKIIDAVRNIEKLSENKNSNNNNMRKVILTESDIHNIIRNSVNRILKEDASGHIFYDPSQGEGDEKEEWEEAGLNIYDLSMVEDPDIAEFHNSTEGYTVYFNDDEFGEVWFDEQLDCYRGVSDNILFNGYKRGFEGMRLNDVFEDIMDKTADAILNEDEYEDEDYDDEYYDEDNF